MMSGKGKLHFTKKFYFLAALVAVFILMPVLSFAQGLPDCNGNDDPFGNCPLDANVWILACIAIVAGAVFIYKQQQASPNQS